MRGERPSADEKYILLVDDDAAVRGALQGFITSIGHPVITAEHGGQAADIIAERGSAIRMLITDICMPVMDGIALIRHVRERLPDLPIVVVTGYADDDELHAVQPEITALFRKPVRFGELAALLGKPGDHPSDKLSDH